MTVENRVVSYPSGRGYLRPVESELGDEFVRPGQENCERESLYRTTDESTWVQLTLQGEKVRV